MAPSYCFVTHDVIISCYGIASIIQDNRVEYHGTDVAQLRIYNNSPRPQDRNPAKGVIKTAKSKLILRSCFVSLDINDITPPANYARLFPFLATLWEMSI